MVLSLLGLLGFLGPYFEEGESFRSIYIDNTDDGFLVIYGSLSDSVSRSLLLLTFIRPFARTKFFGIDSSSSSAGGLNDPLSKSSSSPVFY